MVGVSIIIPVYNDHESLSKLLVNIDNIKTEKLLFDVIIVDDCSEQPVSSTFSKEEFTKINSITILRLIYNCGHQLAIKVGLRQVLESPTDFTVVMDGDGEDNPEEIENIVRESMKSQRIVVASRGERYDSCVFKVFYRIYTWLFRIMTGNIINFGNFSVIPHHQLKDICSMNTIGVHYPATLLKSKLGIKHLKINRGKRYAGDSKMNLSNLIYHGLKSFSVFNEIVIPRLLIFSSGVITTIVLAIVTIVTLKILGLATPGWASNLASSLLILSFQVFTITFISLIFIPTTKPINGNLTSTKTSIKFD